MFTKNFQIKEITCHACISLSQSVLGELEGVSNVEIDPKIGKVSLVSDREISNEQIMKAMRQIDKEVIF